jgi:hypothetical protein
MYSGNLDFSGGGIKICPKCGEFNQVSQSKCCLCSESFEVASDANWFASAQSEMDTDALFVTKPVFEEIPVAHSVIPDSIVELATTDVWLLTRSIVDGCISRLHLH